MKRDKYYCSNCTRIGDMEELLDPNCFNCGSTDIQFINYQAVKKAAQTWVGRFNAISRNLIDNDFNNDPDNWIKLTCEDDYKYFPMWRTMWTLHSSDANWIRENLDLVEHLGIVVFEHYEDNEIYIGINGAGYDFYENHWIPLYLEIGFEWH